MPSLDFDMMPAVGINIMVTGLTTQTVKNVGDESVLDFHVEENLGNREPKDFCNRPNTSAQSINLPWLNQESTSSRNTPCTPRGYTPRLKRGRVTLSQLSSTRKTRSQSLASALQENPLPTMTQNETSSET
ncbi:hypothetical protein RirG_170560 [Rhizophagus irregularis DAOM 197198w]|uniref:Uncharacterized protein n=1 Tax=Rhizophagus irregularis (strain DAOM 197198w) TaxID=1432141 RepID=A0A015J429_RHIIW|nr:hypothetical protein RirG_170560 [Rhizophagus irregularis DAOM 197198w]